MSESTKNLDSQLPTSEIADSSTKAQSKIATCKAAYAENPNSPAAKTLNLARCGLSEIPDEVFDCYWLEELILSNRYFDWEKRKWVNFDDSGSYNLLRGALPDDFAKLTDLKKLHAGGSGDVDIIIGGDYWTTVFSDNWQISDISVLEKLPSLQTLNLSGNQTSNISVLEKLPSLQALYLSSNQISDISVLEKLPSLQTLDLNDNQISNISVLEKLPSLQALYLRYNQISDISVLEKLPSLQALYLSNNQISDISPLLPLIRLGRMPISLEEYDTGGKINLHNCPIQTPPLEVVRQGNQAIIDWFAANKETLNEIKIILIGDPKAGKTSLLRRLKDNTFSESEAQTDGINIEPIAFGTNEQFQAYPNLSPLTGYFWDFGGQEIMNATHQFFLTKRTVYILVLDARKDTNISSQVRQWVSKIAAKAEKASIIVVCNQIDINPGFDFENEYELKGEFPQIKHFLKVSCKTKENLHLLTDAIAELLPQAELFHTEIDERWLKIKKQLRAETKDKHFLNEARFQEICATHKLHDKRKRNNAIRFLHDLGIVLHFKDLAQDLAEYFVLDPYWITYGVYQIITSKRAAACQGKVPYGDLEFIINEEEEKESSYQATTQRAITYSTNERRFLVDILHEFKLCFFTPDRCHFVLPDLLEAKEPERDTIPIREADQSIEFVYDYKTPPSIVLSYFIVELNDITSHIWRTGCLITHANCQALLSRFDKKLSITVIGEHKQKRELMSILRYNINRINGKLNLKPKQLIPLPDNLGTVSHQTLLKMEKKGRRYYDVYDPIEREFEITQLLEGISDLSENDNVLLEELKHLRRTVAEQVTTNAVGFNQVSTKIAEQITTTKNGFSQISDKLEKQQQELLAAIDNKEFEQVLLDFIANCSKTNALQIAKDINEFTTAVFQAFDDETQERFQSIHDEICAAAKSSNTDVQIKLGLPLLVRLFGLDVQLTAKFNIKKWANEMYAKHQEKVFQIMGLL